MTFIFHGMQSEVMVSCSDEQHRINLCETVLHLVKRVLSDCSTFKRGLSWQLKLLCLQNLYDAEVTRYTNLSTRKCQACLHPTSKYFFRDAWIKASRNVSNISTFSFWAVVS